jgi:voltage-gated potassium channel
MVTLLTLLYNPLKRHPPLALLILAATCTLLGAWAFSATQHVPFTTGVYWAITTATTVGYGDVTPKSGIGRLIAVGVMLTAIPLFGGVFALLAAIVTATRLRRMLGLDRRLPPPPYVCVYGADPAVVRAAEELSLAGSRVVLIAELDENLVPDSVFHLPGDPTEEGVVRRSRPDQASQALISGEDDAQVLMCAVLVRHLAPDLEVLAVASSSKVTGALVDLGVQHTVSTDDLLGHTLAKSLETPHAADVLLRMVDSDRYRLTELPVSADLVGLHLSEVRRRAEMVVLGVVHDGAVTLGVEQDPELDAADTLLVLALNGVHKTRRSAVTPAS